MEPRVRAHTPDFLRGIIAPMLTPVHADRSLDLDGVSAMVDWLAARKCVRSIFARSGMGKMYTFTVDETKRLGEAVNRADRGRMGFLLGACGEWTGYNNGERPDPDRYVEQAVELTRFAGAIGADAAVHVVPAAMDARDGETVHEMVYRYYAAVSGAAALPIVIYQPQGTPAEYQITPEVLLGLVAVPRIAGMKLSTNDPTVFGPIAEAVKGRDFALICGHEGYYLNGLRQGACGVIGQGCDGYPEILNGVQRAFHDGELDDARRAQEDVGHALEATGGIDGSVILKQYMIRKGVRIEPYDRSGTAPYDDATVDRVERDLDRLIGAWPVPRD